MKLPFFCCIYFFFLLQRSFINAVVYLSTNVLDEKRRAEVTCKTPLRSLNLEFFSLAYIVGLHNDESISYLEKWVPFLFSHFFRLQDFVQFTKTIYAAKFDLNELACFQRAVNLYLMVQYSHHFQKMTELEPFLEAFHQDLEEVNKFVLQDFQWVIDTGNFKLIKTLFNEDQKASSVSFRYNIRYPKVDLGLKAKAYNESAYLQQLENLVKLRFYNIYLSEFKKEDPSFGKLNDYELSIVMDFNWLFNVSYLSFNSKTDITYVNFALFEKERKKKLGIRIRSSKFNLTLPETESANLRYFNENGLFQIDDMVDSFFSMLKYKMVKGNDALIADIKKVKEQNKFELKGLKGLRKLKYFFKKKSLKSIIDMNLELVSTELRFLTEDFITLFEKSAEVLVMHKELFPFHSYLELRGFKRL